MTRRLPTGDGGVSSSATGVLGALLSDDSFGGEDASSTDRSLKGVLVKQFSDR